MPPRFGWLAHLSRAVDHLLQGYKAIVQHLDQLRSSDAGAMSVQQCKAKKFAQMILVKLKSMHLCSTSPQSSPTQKKTGDQWTMLKARIFMERQSFEKLTWAGAGRVHGNTCPDIMNLMDLIQVIPEREFNVMKGVKSD